MTQPTITTTVKTTDENNGNGYYCIQEIFPSGAVATSGHWDTPEEAFAVLDADLTAGSAGETAQVLHKRYERIILTTTTTYVTTITR